MIALLIGKNQKIRKSTLLHSLFLTQCLDNLSLCNLKIFQCISIEKMEPRNIPRSRPSASTSKRTSASIFSILIHRKIFKLHSDKLSKHFVKTMREGKYHRSFQRGTVDYFRSICCKVVVSQTSKMIPLSGRSNRDHSRAMCSGPSGRIFLDLKL